MKGGPFIVKENKVYGSGVLDMKGGLTILFSTLAALQQDGNQMIPIKVILEADEESNHLYSDAHFIIMKEAKGALCAFNFETGFVDHGLVVQRSGCRDFSIEIHGRDCHMGNDPENGRSSILEMAHKIIEIESLTNQEEQIWLNVGTITGGTVSNSRPAYCKAVINLHYTKREDFEIIKMKISEICKKNWVAGTQTVIQEGVGYDVMERSAGNLKLLKIAQEAAQENRFPVPYGKHCGGGSDAAYTTAIHVPTLCAMGVEGARNHTTEEWADLNSLFVRTKEFIAIILKLQSQFFDQ